MAHNPSNLKITFAVQKVIQPFYTGGKVALDGDSRFLVTTLDEDVLIVDYETGDELIRIEGVCTVFTSFNEQPTSMNYCSDHILVTGWRNYYDPCL